MMQQQLGLNNLYGKASFEFYQTDTGFLVIEEVEDDSLAIVQDMPNIMKSLAERGIQLSKWKILFKTAHGYDGILADEDGQNGAMFMLAEHTILHFQQACQCYQARVQHGQFISEIK